MWHSNKAFQIKISDLLNDRQTDRISFENKMLSLLPELSSEGVSGTLLLQSLDEHSIFVTVEELRCQLLEQCEQCALDFVRDVQVEDYKAKFSEFYKEDAETEEDVMPIDMRNGIIDVEELLYHAIQLQKPIVNRCPDCEEKVAHAQNAEDEDLYEGNWSV